MNNSIYSYSEGLQTKIDQLNKLKLPIQVGALSFSSNLLMAPMSGISLLPLRILLQELGAGCTVTELISCHGINYGNQKTLNMLYIDPKEKFTGIQLFGADPKAMAKAAIVAQEHKAKFIDINMGCPMNKVIKKGAGAALMTDPKKVEKIISEIKKNIQIPLSIKVRLGMNSQSINANEIIKIAEDYDLAFATIHGRTRTQLYSGVANWDYIEEVAKLSQIPIIGNGDLHTPQIVSERANKTNCAGVMLARGYMQNPFIFLESLDLNISFTKQDYFEVIKRLHFLYIEHANRFSWQEKTLLVQFRKFPVWFSFGMNGAAKFRKNAFASKTLEEFMLITEEFYNN